MRIHLGLSGDSRQDRLSHPEFVATLWRTHSCVPRPDSSRRLLWREEAVRRHECRRGTQECVRHNVVIWLQPTI